MVTPGPSALADTELLLEYLRHLETCSEGWQAAHVSLSRLSPSHRQQHHLRIAADGFRRLAADDQGQLFRLGTGDLLFFFAAAAEERIKGELHRLAMLFADDPLLRTASPGAGLFHLLPTTDLGPIVAIVQAAGGSYRPGRKEEIPATVDATDEELARRRRQPVPLALLAKLDRVLAQTDLSSFLRRHPVCRLAGDAPPQPVLTRLSVALSELSLALLPVGDLGVDRAIARYVGESIGRRLLALVGRPEDAAAISGPIGLPLSAATLTSDAFRRFDEQLFRARRSTIVLEIDITDIFGNLEDACFACRLARQRGYRICLTGATVRLAPSIDWSQLPFDYATVALTAAAGTSAGSPSQLAGAIAGIGATRLILTEADSRLAIDAAAAAGVELFQGRYVDHALREAVRRRQLRAGRPRG